MLNLFLRCVILYFFLLLAMRLMGKRQLGELQPFELAITLVASELVCIPMADASIPIIYGIIPVFSLFLIHIIITKLATKSVRFRKFLNGKPVIIIEKGNILPDVMKELNMNVDDIMEALRSSGYFNPSDVEYAILETNGSLTVLPKSASKPLSAEDMGIDLPRANLPVTVIMEGEFMGENLSQLNGITKKRVLRFLDRLQLDKHEVLMLLVSGEDVFVQPYHGNFITATLAEDGDEEITVSVKDNPPPKLGEYISNGDVQTSSDENRVINDENYSVSDNKNVQMGQDFKAESGADAANSPQSAQTDNNDNNNQTECDIDTPSQSGDTSDETKTADFMGNNRGNSSDGNPPNDKIDASPHDDEGEKE